MIKLCDYFFIFLICFCVEFHVYTTRDPFQFVKKMPVQKREKKQVCMPRLNGIASCSNKNIALLSHNDAAYIVEEGQTIDQWTITHLSSSYIVVIDEAGTRKNIFLSPDIP